MRASAWEYGRASSVAPPVHEGEPPEPPASLAIVCAFIFAPRTRCSRAARLSAWERDGARCCFRAAPVLRSCPHYWGTRSPRIGRGGFLLPCTTASSASLLSLLPLPPPSASSASLLCFPPPPPPLGFTRLCRARRNEWSNSNGGQTVVKRWSNGGHGVRTLTAL